MNLFQLLTLSVLLILVASTVSVAARGQIRKRIAGFWLLVWVGSIVTVAWPESTAVIARALGVGRGADLVMYCSVVTMLTGFFYIYARFRRLDRQLTLLVRRLAVDNPIQPQTPRTTGSDA